MRQWIVERNQVESALADALLASSQSGIVSAYLFGSHAAGRAHRESDVDLGVLLDWAVYTTETDRVEEQLGLIAQLTRAVRGLPLDLVILNDLPPTFARHIVTHGRRIFCRNAEADHAFLRDTLLRAADLDPFLKRMRRIKLAALAR
jgi:predicted nucleotidyltransferase